MRATWKVRCRCQRIHSWDTACPKCGKVYAKGEARRIVLDFVKPDGKRSTKAIGTASTKSRADTLTGETVGKITSGKYQHVKSEIKTLGQLSTWYLSLPDVQRVESIKAVEFRAHNLLERLGHSLPIAAINAGTVHEYQERRMTEDSTRKDKDNPGQLRKIAPATVHKEIQVLQAMLNKSVVLMRIPNNPIARLPAIRYNNVRERVLKAEEFERLLSECPDYLKPAVLLAYYCGLRQAEVFGLTWQEIDFEHGVILKAGRETAQTVRTKTGKGRAIPMHPRVIEALRNAPTRFGKGRVFSITRPNRSYFNAVYRAGLGDFTFHDLRHCAANNLRLAGNSKEVVKEILGHQSDSMFKRYTLISKEEIMGVKWLDTAAGDGK